MEQVSVSTFNLRIFKIIIFEFALKGTYYFGNKDRYVGNWVNNERTGDGVYYFSNGDRYEGAFVKSELHGTGVYYFINGDQYDGSW